jgi:thermostable 8-oxoguanine DNA glycosylase
VLHTLKHHGVIKDIPHTLSKKTYLEIEEKMQTFADEIEIPLSHLDLLIWYNTTGDLFK